jgi:flagellar basal-body rod protein FlgB
MSMFDDGASLAIGRALDGVSLRQRVTADNIANVMTPGFQAQRVDFENSLASAISAGDPTAAQASVSETADASREDGNNVDIESETSSLMRSGVQYQALAQAMSFKFSVLHTAIKG